MTDIDWIARAQARSFEVYNVIGGERGPAGGAARIDKFAARNGALLYTFGEGARDDVDRAVAAAKTAFDDGRWSRKSVHERKAVLAKLADLIEAHAEDFALNESMDVGKPITAALHGDVPLAAGVLREAAAAADKLHGASAVDGGIHSYQLRKPIGVVGAIVGWNYPLLLACQKVGPALIMGNSLVLKPSEFTSLSACRLAELALEAGVPEGVFNVVNGAGAIVGDGIARHPDVRVLSFTGSSATGRRLQVAAGQSNMKRLVLECGGKSPYLIFDAYPGDLDALADDIIRDTAYRNQGAVCVSSTRLLLQDGIRQRLLPKLLERTQAIEPGDPLLPDTTFGAIMNEQHMDKVLGYVASGLEDGAQLLCGGERILRDTGGYYLSPAIFDHVKPSQRIAREETFGPLVSLFTFRTEEEAIALANDSEYGLAAYAATGDANRMHRLARDLEAGHIILIGSLEAAPGGVVFGIEPAKQSGMGVEGGVAGLAPYTACAHVMTLFNG